MEKKFKLKTTSMSLHMMAMLFMLCDHLWGIGILSSDWLTCVGRISFPIFAFLIAEGYFHTKNLKRYILRLLLFAIISEIPFNFMVGGNWFYPFHQNVLWSFLISIGLVHLNEKVKKTNKVILRFVTALCTVILAYVLGLITMVDYYHAGILTVLVFYFFREEKWWCRICQFVCLWYINTEMLKGFYYPINLFGIDFELQRQSIALLALIPIWLYKGEQGYHTKTLKWFYYAFYPLHMAILVILKNLL